MISYFEPNFIEKFLWESVFFFQILADAARLATRR